MKPWRTIALSLVTATALTGLFAACLTPEDVARAEFCDGYCGCGGALPSDYDECFLACDEELVGQPISDECVECAQETACSAINTCLDICFGVFEEES
jgi:hypothetical protein